MSDRSRGFDVTRSTGDLDQAFTSLGPLRLGVDPVGFSRDQRDGFQIADWLGNLAIQLAQQAFSWDSMHMNTSAAMIRFECAFV